MMKTEYSQLIKHSTKHKFIGEHALMLLGDSSEILSKADLEGINIQSVITDPPYDFKSQGGPTFKRKDSYIDKMRDKGNDITAGFDFDIIRNLSFVNSMIIWMHNDQIYKIMQLLTEGRRREFVNDETGLDDWVFIPRLYERYILAAWHKTNPLPVAQKHYLPDTEFYIHAWNKPFSPQGDLADKTRFIVSPVEKNNIDHPTVKPQFAMVKCVINGSCPGDTVIDPFTGSGSTGVACLMHGRRFIGIEKSEKYFNIAVERLQGVAGIWEPNEREQQALFY